MSKIRKVVFDLYFFLVGGCFKGRHALSVKNVTHIISDSEISSLNLQKCYTWYENPDDPITQDSTGQDEQCVWCGEGEEIICCDTCRHSICHTCIRENLGKQALDAVLAGGRCYCCV